MKCQATTKKGLPCNGGAMPGSEYCGPHAEKQKASTIVSIKEDAPDFVKKWVHRVLPTAQYKTKS